MVLFKRHEERARSVMRDKADLHRNNANGCFAKEVLSGVPVLGACGKGSQLFKAVPIAISLLALAVSASSLYLSFLSFRSGRLPPEVNTRLNEFELVANPISVSASFDFSVSNHSSRTLFIVKCEVATNGLNAGGGGYGERFSPCGLEEFDATGGLELSPSQTEFFSVVHNQDLDSFDPALALKLMGIELGAIESSLAEGPCTAQLSVSRNGAGMNQNCGLMQSSTDHFLSRRPTQKVFDLVLQTGTGDLIRTPVYLSIWQPWPWGT